MNIKNVCLFAIIVFLISCAGAPTPDTMPTPSQPQPETPSPEAVEPVVEEEEGFSVSEEVFLQTFEEIEDLIMELNMVISKRQYDRWLTYLSEDYIARHNDQNYLNEINQLPQMKDNGITLKRLKDYFNWVVVPSRSQAVLGEIVFNGETKVVAYSSFNGKRAKLYEFEKLDGEWKVSIH
ncbi:MAG: hypothetical protein MI717_09500 [Spirochaetales bacterium]|nr:hypothetical protein [Spirochaetales bacterium]